jgi:D-alanine-D-alanine ligase
MKNFTFRQQKQNGNNHSSNSNWTVALTANLKDKFIPDSDDPPDAGAEFDRIETIHHITNAIESDGHKVHFINADHKLPKVMMDLKPDICFNIAEGVQGDSREAQVPALCELLGIPYTASRVLPNAISLDKTITKRIWRDYGLPTAPFQEFSHLEELQNLELDFPLFVKPAREGTGMGIDEGALVFNFPQLRDRVSWLIESYHQPALVEEFLPGREFTVGFIGNPGSPAGRRHPELYDQNGYHWFPVLEIDLSNSVSPTVYGHDAKSLDIGESGAPDYLCPADIEQPMIDELIDLTHKAAEALNVCDISRVDFRLGKDGKPYLMEINTLPGLNPAISDICIMADAEGMSYNTLILEILYLAAERLGLQVPDETSAVRGLEFSHFDYRSMSSQFLNSLGFSDWFARRGRLA